jgi:hypothetical protein
MTVGCMVPFRESVLSLEAETRACPDVKMGFAGTGECAVGVSATGRAPG